VSTRFGSPGKPAARRISPNAWFIVSVDSGVSVNVGQHRDVQLVGITPHRKVQATNPWAQKSQTSSAVMGWEAASSVSAPDCCATNMTVCMVIAAIRRGLTPLRNCPAALTSSISSVNSACSGAWAILTSDG